MEKIFLILIFITISSTLSTSKQYRTDYVYNRKTDAFYKLHTETMRFWDINDICKVEGASVMMPAIVEDLVQIHGMFKKYPDLGDYAWVANDGHSHDSAEAQPIIDLSASESEEVNNGGCDVVSRDADVMTMPCYRQLPFICKVKANDAPYDQRCGVYGTGYKYYPTVGSCYKIPRIVYSWNEAYAECEAEGAHLVVLNSEAERDVVKNITNTERMVPGTKASWFFFAGFRAQKTTDDTPRVFKTVFNQTLEEAGFAEWSTGEPNNAGGTEYCGSIFKKDGNLNDVDCTHTYAFICEKEVKNNT